MKELVILSRLEEEYVVRALESALHVRKLQQFFLWVQGELQGLLPHGILVCIHFGEDDEVRRIEYLHRMAHDPGVVKWLCEPVEGFAVRLAHYCRANRSLPSAIEREARDAQHPLNAFHAEIVQHGLRNALVHGTERLCGGATFFSFFSMPDPPTTRQAFFLELLLPCLHLAFLRVVAQGDGETYVAANAMAQPLTAREVGILRLVTKGKSNDEIGAILDLSPVTVKNHMHKIYKKLKVHNRVQAILRCHALQLLNPGNG